MTGKLTADEIVRLLQLEPNATCGFVRLTFVSKQSLEANVLPSPFAEPRPVGTALYFMVMPNAPVRLHRIRNDQLYHYYLGDPLEVFMLNAEGLGHLYKCPPVIRLGRQFERLLAAISARFLYSATSFIVRSPTPSASCASRAKGGPVLGWGQL
jgi:uncharacterized protein